MEVVQADRACLDEMRLQYLSLHHHYIDRAPTCLTQLLRIPVFVDCVHVLHSVCVKLPAAELIDRLVKEIKMLNPMVVAILAPAGNLILTRWHTFKHKRLTTR